MSVATIAQEHPEHSNGNEDIYDAAYLAHCESEIKQWKNILEERRAALKETRRQHEKQTTKITFSEIKNYLSEKEVTFLANQPNYAWTQVKAERIHKEIYTSVRDRQETIERCIKLTKFVQSKMAGLKVNIIEQPDPLLQ